MVKENRRPEYAMRPCHRLPRKEYRTDSRFDYPLLHMAEAPDVEVEVIDSDGERPAGVAGTDDGDTHARPFQRLPHARLMIPQWVCGVIMGVVSTSIGR